MNFTQVTFFAAKVTGKPTPLVGRVGPPGTSGTLMKVPSLKVSRMLVMFSVGSGRSWSTMLVSTWVVGHVSTAKAPASSPSDTHSPLPVNPSGTSRRADDRRIVQPIDRAPGR